MAKNPNLEDGFTQIANELMEQVPRFKFNGTHLRIILVIWRYTYGFHRKKKDLSVSYIAEATGIYKKQIERELNVLIDRKVVTVVSIATGRRPRILGFNKNYDEWEDVDPSKKGSQMDMFSTLELEGSDPSKKRTQDDRSTLGLEGQERNILKKTLKKGIYAEIIGYLNERTGKRFNHKVKNTQELINGRLNEGRTFEDFIQVIDTKCSHWLDDEKMNQYLRPDTLFRPSNFDRYLNQETSAEQKRDPTLESRDKEVAFQQWIQEGNDPDGFDWSR
ncbi:conserved phage C-terminal domain-containing protein [Paenibacillus cymbidii]|uniref:conserved phage C-terminal domain-containing protein n=1 Tax=Paenibacillus cymbidii TaxID=1639034 RepID=UPI0010815CD8|nr:conserved phage C-terminal domain-containing protein [Paenibacillus cymbidii]